MSQQKQLNVDLTKIRNERCMCGNMFFDQAYIIKKISGLIAGTGTQDIISPVLVYKCSVCGLLHPMFQQATIEPKEDPSKILKVN